MSWSWLPSGAVALHLLLAPVGAGVRGVPALDPPPADSVDYGCKGGRTGGGSGIAVTSGGEIVRWRRDRALAPRAVVDRWVDTASAVRLIRALHTAGFLSLPPGEGASYICAITLVEATDTHTVLFLPGSPPAPLREVDSLLQVLRRAESAK